MSITCNKDDETLFRLQINIKESCYWGCRTIMNWEIEDQYGSPIHRSEHNQQYTETTNEEFCLHRNECYKFHISSDYYRNAGYNLYQDGDMIMSNLGSATYKYYINDKYFSCMTPSPSSSPTRLPVDPSNSHSDNGFATGYLLAIFVSILACCLCAKYCLNRYNQSRGRQQQSQHLVEESTSEEIKKQNRRLKIRTGIIHKVSSLISIPFFRCKENI